MLARENVEIRRAAKAAEVPLWKIASFLQISEPTLTRWMRFPLSEEKQERIMEAISVLGQEVT